MLTLVEDLGRPGLAGTGVSPSGALDVRSLRAANRAVGNDAGAAALETVGGLRVRARGRLVVAATGALAALTSMPDDGGPERMPAFGGAFTLGDGDELRLGTPARGARTYLAVRGGLDVPATLGSRSTDVLSGLGPAPLAAGGVLPVGDLGTAAIPLGDAGAADPGSLPVAGGEAVVLRLVLGPRDDWFDDDSLDALGEQEWEVTPRSNRVGLRLSGVPLRRRPGTETRELPSEGCVTGALQVPPDGQPVLFLADHPVTGGYPVVGAVVAAQLGLAGQLPVGARVRFEPIRQNAPTLPPPVDGR
jgi:biotin-dependent carboxylase-like uncharacterized protein